MGGAPGPKFYWGFMAKSWLLGHPVEITESSQKGTIVRTFAGAATLMVVVQVEGGALVTVTANMVNVLDAPGRK